MKNTHDQVSDLLTTTFSPTHLLVENESALHKGHRHGGEDSHFRVTLVSAQFEGKTNVARHRLIYQCLGSLLPTPIHALAIHAFSPQEWLTSSTR